MKKQDIIIAAVLIALMLMWGPIYRKFVHPHVAPEAPLTSAVSTNRTAATAPAMNVPEAPVKADVPVEETEPATIYPETPEQTVALTNARLRLTFSSHGAGIKTVVLNDYAQTIEENSPPVHFSFTDRTALSYAPLEGFDAAAPFDMVEAQSDTVRFRRTRADGVTLERTITLEGDYLIRVTDRFSNETGQPVLLTEAGLTTGIMTNLPGESSFRGQSLLDAHVLATLNGKVKRRGRKLPNQFKKYRERGQARMPMELNWQPEDPPEPVDWLAVHNKYFTQIVTPDLEADYYTLYSRRKLSDVERTGGIKPPKQPELTRIAGTLYFPERLLEPGESFDRSMNYYMGPKKYRILKQFPARQADIMSFGLIPPVGKMLLPALNAIHIVIPNYGVAIMLLTLIVKLVFWPITRKGTQSMRRMQTLQPLMNEIKEKYKKDPQRQQQELMKLYKVHKINPVGGCLPMIIQIPVFIALFNVLRSAIELRYASFLWIADLSEPERLIELGFTVPILGWDALNLLPLVMAATMVWQQRLMPSTGDAQQQKMMGIMMPAMMLFFLYNMSSGLILYWTTNQCLSIIEQLLNRHRKKAEGSS